MKKIEIDTFLQFQFVSNPLFSPDGANAAFLVTVPDREQNTYHGDLYVTRRFYLRPHQARDRRISLKFPSAAAKPAGRSQSRKPSPPSAGFPKTAIF